jgi:tetratricopeptide (TPR) repeat protein
MTSNPVYKTLVGLALVAVLVSNLDTALAADPAKGPATSPPLKSAVKAPVAADTSLNTTAEAAFKKGDYEAVTKLLWKNIESLDHRELVLLALAHEKKKEAANMLKVANILTSKDPKDFQGFYLTGTAHWMNKKSAEALEALKTTLELNPKYQPAYDRLAEMYEQKNNMYELRILYQDMVEQLGPKPEFLSKLCEINATDFTEDQAIKYCKEALAKDPRRADNQVYLGLTRLHAGDKEEAKKVLKSAADAHTKSEFAQYSYASLLDDEKNFLEASKYYNAGVVADPKASRSWLGYAKASFEIQKFEQALEAFKKACKLDRKMAVSFRKAANLLKASKDATWVAPYETASESCSGY